MCFKTGLQRILIDAKETECLKQECLFSQLSIPHAHT